MPSVEVTSFLANGTLHDAENSLSFFWEKILSCQIKVICKRWQYIDDVPLFSSFRLVEENKFFQFGLLDPAYCFAAKEYFTAAESIATSIPMAEPLFAIDQELPVFAIYGNRGDGMQWFADCYVSASNYCWADSIQPPMQGQDPLVEQLRSISLRALVIDGSLDAVYLHNPEKKERYIMEAKDKRVLAIEAVSGDEPTIGVDIALGSLQFTLADLERLRPGSEIVLDATDSFRGIAYLPDGVQFATVQIAADGKGFTLQIEELLY